MLVFRCLHDDVSWLTTFRRNFTRYLKHRYDEHYSTCTEQEPTVTRTNTQNLHLSVHVHVHTLWSPTWAPAGFLGGWTQSFSSPNTFCTEAAGYTGHLHLSYPKAMHSYMGTSSREENEYFTEESLWRRHYYDIPVATPSRRSRPLLDAFSVKLTEPLEGRKVSSITATIPWLCAWICVGVVLWMALYDHPISLYCEDKTSRPKEKKLLIKAAIVNNLS